MGAVYPNIPEELVRFLRARSGVQLFIETGTYLGATTEKASALFEKVKTIEAQPDLFERARQKFSGVPNVEVLFGNSGEALGKLLNEVNEPALFWLDAHWSGGITAGENYECPVVAELEHVVQHRQDHIILIDDARYFLAPPYRFHDWRSWPDFPAISELLNRNGQRKTIVTEDVIVSVPISLAADLVGFVQDRYSPDGTAVVRNDEDDTFRARMKNVYSQGGEDGVIEYLLEKIRTTNGYFVEFGAWDGRHLSNCAKLADEGWSGCFIEGDNKRFLDLQRNYSARENVTLLNAVVGTSGRTSLDTLLNQAHAPEEPTIVSIDIDGNDYSVWSALSAYRPLICVVEFNPTIPAVVSFAQRDDPTESFGSSLSALTELGRTKGYSLVAATELNAFFLRNDKCSEFSVRTYAPAEVKETSSEVHLFYGYDGLLRVTGRRELIWHGVTFGETELQLLPEKLRKFPVGQGLEYERDLVAFRSRPKARG